MHRFNGNQARRSGIRPQPVASMRRRGRFRSVRLIRRAQIVASHRVRPNDSVLRGGTSCIRALACLFLSPMLSIEGGNNFRDRYAPSVGATISRQIDDVAAV